VLQALSVAAGTAAEFLPAPQSAPHSSRSDSAPHAPGRRCRCGGSPGVPGASDTSRFMSDVEKLNRLRFHSQAAGTQSPTTRLFLAAWALSSVESDLVRARALLAWGAQSHLVNLTLPTNSGDRRTRRGSPTC